MNFALQTTMQSAQKLMQIPLHMPVAHLLKNFDASIPEFCKFCELLMKAAFISNHLGMPRIQLG